MQDREHGLAFYPCEVGTVFAAVKGRHQDVGVRRRDVGRVRDEVAGLEPVHPLKKATVVYLRQHTVQSNTLLSMESRTTACTPIKVFAQDILTLVW